MRSTGHCAAASATASGCGARSRAGTRRGQHAYFTSSSDDRGQEGGAQRAVLRQRPACGLRRCCSKHRLELGDGMKVRIFGHLDFYAPARPARAQDDRHRPALHARRAGACSATTSFAGWSPTGLLDANRRARFRRRSRSASVSSASVDTAAWPDFHDELERSASGSTCVCATCGCRAKAARGDGQPRASPPLGCGAATSTSSSSSAAAGRATSWPRSTPRPIALAIAAVALPVFTGLGHEIDRSVADEVAHTAFKTPTACAAALVDAVAAPTIDRANDAGARSARVSDRQLGQRHGAGLRSTRTGSPAAPTCRRTRRRTARDRVDSHPHASAAALVVGAVARRRHRGPRRPAPAPAARRRGPPPRRHCRHGSRCSTRSTSWRAAGQITRNRRRPCRARRRE